jgi:hypothetical protein
MSIQRRALFIDDISKEVIFTDDLENAANQLEDDDDKMEVAIHLDNANWLPALGYSSKFDGHTFLAGATESGKSYFIRKMILNDRYHRQVILFTNLSKDDESFQGMTENLIKFDPSGENGWDWLLKNNENKIMIFDDIKRNYMFQNYRDKMLEEGRHFNTVVICVNHRLQDFSITRVALNDCRYLVTFPSANKGNVKRFLKDEYGMLRNQLKDLFRQIKNSRYLIIHKFAPICVASTDSIFKL